MSAAQLSGGFVDAPRDGAHAFRAVLNAMSRPGTIVELDAGHGPAPISPAAATVLLTLCDPTTPLHLAGSHDNPALRDWIAFHCAAPIVAVEQAVFALGTWQALQPLQGYSIGTPEYPDRSATLIVDGHDFDALPSRLTGPGIHDWAQLALPDARAFIANHTHFPLGWDAILTSGSRLAALPRSTEVR
ncbi:phosphonate C-P lyase system protein PhnH [Paracoccus sp. MBLB3053]|uniref:Phosphonate C-P lyase system protein PhnH n=1 Tax=Paracoccus aurantius TaxID=3073814 RepID=A0ABU2HV62_9RHOB|nr:phosphonate C-P lyase system protein PhnH [Paracoccus sp. MBLB3053]MDS9468946.1 phosphonate C-P lyase system protein PhnH [Paracoccus sp. MBLB3053]